MTSFIGTNEQYTLQRLLRQKRIEAGLKQIELAKLLGQSQAFVSKYENGERRLDLLELRAICIALKIKLQDFIKIFEESLNEAK